MDTLCAFVEFCWQSLTHKSHSQVRRILAIQLGYEPCLKGLLGRKLKIRNTVPNTPLADNITGERTEAAAESAAEGSDIFTEVTPEIVAE